jgi:predicted CxxxxCH...CXXCH cytochrome family protein
MSRFVRAGARRALATASLAALLVCLACNAPPDGRAPESQRVQPTGAVGDVCVPTGAHAAHARFACAACHPCGGALSFDVPVTFPGGTTSEGGTIVRDASGATCTVACHAPLGGTPAPIAWATPGPLPCTGCHLPATLPGTHVPVSATATRAECEACHQLDGHTTGTTVVVSHGAAWSDPASAGFHAPAANAGLAGCTGCHGPRLAGTSVARGCGSCHDADLPAGVASWDVNCVMCHGGAELPNGAPPEATWGNAGDPLRVGAHTLHLTTSRAPEMTCTTCHPTQPADAFTPGHVDGGTAEVHLARSADGATAAWDRASGRCSGTYCHAGNGGAEPAPSWTAPATGRCDGCHGLPPAVGHPRVGPELAGCAPCHPDTIAPGGQLIAIGAGGRHLDGAVQAIGGHTDAFKADTESPDFHAFEANRALVSCAGCHGPTLEGGIAPACAQCHGVGWDTGCVMCHGGVANLTGAPPKATWRSTSATAIGAHTAHVTARSGLSAPLACELCHPRPLTPLAAGHADGSIDVTGYTGSDPWLLAAVGSPGWNGTSCATSYCHGSLLGAGVPQPDWTSTSALIRACNGCHGMPPADGPLVGGQPRTAGTRRSSGSTASTVTAATPARRWTRSCTSTGGAT